MKEVKVEGNRVDGEPLHRQVLHHSLRNSLKLSNLIIRWQDLIIY